MAEYREVYEVAKGDVLYRGRCYFRVLEVREPSNPLYGGLVFRGHWRDMKRGVWGKEANLSIHYGESVELANDGLVASLPDKYFSAYMEPGDLAVLQDFANGCSLWSFHVKCRVLEFGEEESRVLITGDSLQCVQWAELTVPSQRLFRREHARRR